MSASTPPTRSEVSAPKSTDEQWSCHWPLAVLNDGNCLFRALSDQLYACFEHHLQLRQKICDYLVVHAERFRLFVDEDEGGGFEGHVTSMRSAGTYGTNLELSAFASLYRRPVRVFQPGLVFVISCGEPDEKRAKDTSHQTSADPTRSDSALDSSLNHSRSVARHSAASADDKASSSPAATLPSSRRTRHKADTQSQQVPGQCSNVCSRWGFPQRRPMSQPIEAVNVAYEHYSSPRPVTTSLESRSLNVRSFYMFISRTLLSIDL
ncbi:BZ3501_MvSof-1269-A2-R1_Chr12-1g03352 [Microbotryum saponariae]|nr:BZ3501_MvSof-1269-A2-R1_Chr12-1g03352 [Microbotryum saponariae]